MCYPIAEILLALKIAKGPSQGALFMWSASLFTVPETETEIIQRLRKRPEISTETTYFPDK